MPIELDGQADRVVRLQDARRSDRRPRVPRRPRARFHQSRLRLAFRARFRRRRHDPLCRRRHRLLVLRAPRREGRPPGRHRRRRLAPILDQNGEPLSRQAPRRCRGAAARRARRPPRRLCLVRAAERSPPLRRSTGTARFALRDRQAAAASSGTVAATRASRRWRSRPRTVPSPARSSSSRSARSTRPATAAPSSSSGPRAGVFSVKRTDDFDVTDATFLPDGDLVVLERKFSSHRGLVHAPPPHPDRRHPARAPRSTARSFSKPT